MMKQKHTRQRKQLVHFSSFSLCRGFFEFIFPFRKSFVNVGKQLMQICIAPRNRPKTIGLNTPKHTITSWTKINSWMQTSFSRYQLKKRQLLKKWVQGIVFVLFLGKQQRVSSMHIVLYSYIHDFCSPSFIILSCYIKSKFLLRLEKFPCKSSQVYSCAFLL